MTNGSDRHDAVPARALPRLCRCQFPGKEPAGVGRRKLAGRQDDGRRRVRVQGRPARWRGVGDRGAQSGGDFQMTDGPYTETKEHLAGFWIINAADLDEALEWAKLAAVAEQRPIEVRPLFGGDLDDAIEANASDAQ